MPAKIIQIKKNTKSSNKLVDNSKFDELPPAPYLASQ
jgi:hypothetical protein